MRFAIVTIIIQIWILGTTIAMVGDQVHGMIFFLSATLANSIGFIVMLQRYKEKEKQQVLNPT